jgi:hypothetical protein
MTRGDRALDVLAMLGVVALTMLAYVLSYAALRELAIDKGEAPWAAQLWPLCLDVAALVAGFIAVRARRRGQRDGYAEGLAVAFAVGVVAANLAGKVSAVIGGLDLVALAVRGTPPMTMLATWHMLIRRLAPARPAVPAEPTPLTIGQDISADTAATVDMRAVLAPTVAALPAIEPDGAADEAESVTVEENGAGTDQEQPASPRSRRPARARVRTLLKRHGPAVSSALVAERAGVSRRHAARLLAEERAALEAGA